ncbi:MAG: 4Fe-4S dicluster domain-containing protein [Candidatus Bathyarchaeia archaeon]
MCAKIWVARDYLNCSGCRKCEIACSLHHEGKIWPEASRIRVFMLTPTLEIPHFCAQCQDYPCIESCPVDALSTNDDTGAVLVDKEKCTACGNCIEACPGRIPHLHPTEDYAVICDLCGGDPQCAKVCQEGRWNALWVAPKPPSGSYRLYARRPEEITKDLAMNLYGEFGEELV